MNQHNRRSPCMSWSPLPPRVARRLVVLVLTLAALPHFAARAADTTSPLRIAHFQADVTIPLNHRCMGVLPTKSQSIDDPLYAHGVVLLSADAPVVLVAVVWCEIRNGAYDQWRDALATAAGTTRERVLLSSLHQHDAPVVDRDAGRLLTDVGLRGELYDEPFHDQMVSRVANALRASLKDALPVTQIGTGLARVERIASSRRIVRANQRVTYERGSRSASDPAMAAADEGTIDPFLRTISFWNHDQPIVALHTYATHPMSRYGEGRVSADFVGLARARRQQERPDVHQIYFSGCSGDVTAGRYNDGSDASREQLITRLLQGMRDAWDAQQRQPVDAIAFRHVPLKLDFHPDPSLHADVLKRTLVDSSQTTEARILAAMSLASRERVERGQPIDVPAVQVGPASIVLLPGESFVAYQLAAQKIRPDQFVMTIGYGECWPGYVPTESDFHDGFHDKWLWVAPGSEARMLEALKKAL